VVNRRIQRAKNCPKKDEEPWGAEGRMLGREGKLKERDRKGVFGPEKGALRGGQNVIEKGQGRRRLVLAEGSAPRKEKEAKGKKYPLENLTSRKRVRSNTGGSELGVQGGKRVGGDHKDMTIHWCVREGQFCNIDQKGKLAKQ